MDKLHLEIWPWYLFENFCILDDFGQLSTSIFTKLALTVNVEVGLYVKYALKSSINKNNMVHCENLREESLELFSLHKGWVLRGL